MRRRLRVGDIPATEWVTGLSSGISIVCPPFVFRISSAISLVGEGIRSLYADYELAEGADTWADFHVSVLARRQWFRPLCVFQMDGTEPFTPLAFGEAFAFLEWGMNWCVTGHCHTFITIHAAVLERHGRAVILPAPPGSGKSTLCAALMLHGWRLLSDEMTLLDPADGSLMPSVRPVSLKNRSIEVIRSRHPSAVFGPVAHDTLKGTVAHLRPSTQSVLRATERATPAWVVFPKFTAGADLAVTPRSKPAALVQLASNSFNQHVHGKAGFEVLADLTDRCDVFDLSYSRLDDALQWFDHLEPPA